MAIFNFLKRKRTEKKAEKTKKIETPSQLKVEKKEEQDFKFEEKGTEITKKKSSFSGLAWKTLKSPRITEKATLLTEKNQYVFKVFPAATKKEIKKAIEDLYGVEAVSVKIINVLPKKRRLGRIEGWRKGYKKAIVKIKEGQKIEVLPR